MGEIADMMLDGILCEGCGELINEVGSGHPIRCTSCDMSPRTFRSVKRIVGRERQALRHNRERRAAAKIRKPHECHCGKLCKTPGGLKAHQRDKHGSAE